MSFINLRHHNFKFNYFILGVLELLIYFYLTIYIFTKTKVPGSDNGIDGVRVHVQSRS